MVEAYTQEWMKLRRSPMLKILFWFSLIAIIDIFAIALTRKYGGAEIKYYSVMMLANLKAIRFYIPAISASFLFSNECRASSYEPKSDDVRVNTYLQKMFVIFSLFMVTFSVTAIEVKVREIHLLLVFLTLIPLFMLIGRVIKSRFWNICLQIIASWIVIQFTMLFQQANPIRDYVLATLSSEMILRTLCNFFIGDKGNLFFTRLFCIIALASLIWGVVLCRRNQNRKRGENRK